MKKIILIYLTTLSYYSFPVFGQVPVTEIREKLGVQQLNEGWEWELLFGHVLAVEAVCISVDLKQIAMPNLPSKEQGAESLMFARLEIGNVVFSPLELVIDYDVPDSSPESKIMNVFAVSRNLLDSKGNRKLQLPQHRWEEGKEGIYIIKSEPSLNSFSFVAYLDFDQMDRVRELLSQRISMEKEWIKFIEISQSEKREK